MDKLFEFVKERLLEGDTVIGVALDDTLTFIQISESGWISLAQAYYGYDDDDEQNLAIINLGSEKDSTLRKILWEVLTEAQK